MPSYCTALTLLSSCLQQSANHGPAANRLALLIPILPNIASPLLPELYSLGIRSQDAGPGQFPLDKRSSACLLYLAQCQNHPISNELLYLHLFSLSFSKSDLDPNFSSAFCKVVCQSEPSLTTTHVIRLTIQSALQNASIPLLLGVLQALSEPPVLMNSEVLQDQLLAALIVAREQVAQSSDGRHRRRRHQWSQIQVRGIRAISLQLQEKLSKDEDLRLSLYGKALGVLGFKNGSEWRPITTSAISVDMYSACAELCVSCVGSDKNLSAELMHCLIKLLKVSSRSGSNLSPAPSNKAVFSQILSSLTRLVINNQRLIRSAVDQLKELLENYSLQQRSDYEDFHEFLSAAVAEILKAELSISGRNFADTFARKLVFSLDQNLLVTKEDSIMREQSLLLLLGRVTALVNNPKLTEHVIPMLMNRFTNSPKFLHIVIPHLTDIALVSEARVFNDVVSLLINIYSKPFIADNKWNRKEIPDALFNLAENVAAPDLRSGLLKSLLKLFKILGRQIQERMEQSVQNSSSMAGVLGFLLPALAVLMVPIDEEPLPIQDRAKPDFESTFSTLPRRHSSLVRISPWDGQSQDPPQPVTVFESADADIKWFRTLWNYLVLYRFADSAAPMWPPAWASAVKTISAHTPALALSATESSQHDIELFAEAGICQASISELRSRLVLLYPQHASVVTSLSNGALVYIMTIEVLESARVVSGTVMPLFAYLHDQTTSFVTKIVDTVSDHIFQLYLDVMSSWPADSSRRQNLESHVVFLFVHSCSRYQRVAAKAAFYLKEVVNRFPFLQWSKTCLSYLFELFNTFQDFSSDIDLISASSSSPPIGGLQLDLADDWKSRTLAQNHIQKMLSRWLENATFIVPSQMASMLQLFIQDWQDTFRSCPTFGVGISLRHLLVGKRQALLSAPVEQDQSASQFTYSMTARQRYLGDVRGRFFTFCQNVENNQRSFGESMASDLLLEFHEILGRHRMIYEGKESQFKRCLYLCAALLVWSVSAVTADDDAACQLSSIPLTSHRAVDPRELMHLVCMAPVYMFTDQTMSYAIDVWSWLFTVSHAFSIGLLVTMKSAWAFTVESRLGLFSPPPDQVSAQFSGCLYTRTSPSYRPGWNGAAPHDAWISFLLDRFDTISDCSLSSVRAVLFMLHKALAKPEYICTAPSSFGPRFRLLLLGLRLVSARSDQELLRNRIMLAAFSWFREGPRWSPHTSWAGVSADAQTIVNFIEAIRRDSGRNSADAAPFAAPARLALSVAAGNKLGLERAPSVGGSVPQQTPSAMRSVRPGTDADATDIFTLASSEGQSAGVVFDWGLRPEIDDAVSIGISPQKDHVDLLLLLLSHEYHCLIAWHNPRRHPERALRDENLYAHNPTVGLAQEDWRRFFLVSWQIDPHLTYRLAQRFPYVRILRSMLRAKLLAEPLALKDIGESSRLLCSQRNCKLNSAILQHLALYDSCSLPTALRFLCPPFSQNRTICQYTLRSLSLHAHSGVIFYMPEIIQALRHDQSASLATFLKSAGTQSPHLAHQLVWALQTESVVGENARRKIADDPLPSICSKLEQDIVASFSNEAAAFFRAEFDFFEQITRLSSELLVIPKMQKEERRAKLQAELQKIRSGTLQTARFPLYLPIDHTAQVVDIIIDTAKPLQSAARVPFLVDFLIKKMSDSDESHETKASSASSVKLPIDGPTIETKQVIFKAGDDCRQDCLALQFIRLFKDILKSIGLPLFVYPYLVIPNRTGAGRDLGGVIECVRKSASRDELGKSSGLSLREYFLSKYGRAEGSAFKQAQRNFVLSMAGYAVCCYLLQVKDRHNGNILLDDSGHVVHIDFGFIFDISPAKDMKWESAGFKLTLEMVEVMDNFDSDMWNWFVDLCVRGYLAVRAHRDDFLALTEIMSDSALGCFKSDSVRNLKYRFVPEKSERDAAQHMISVILDAYNKFSTNTYDLIQYSQQGIYYYAGQPS